MNLVEWSQHRLIAHGFNPGIVDGLWGRNTRAAVIAFQQAKNLPITGTLNEATLQLLKKDVTGSNQTTQRPDSTLLDSFLWMELALRKKGLHEQRDNKELRKFLSSDGPTLGDPARNPWCGDFVETCIAVTLPQATLPSNPYLARNWLKFGQTVEPCFGSILVFWRKTRSGHLGHVGFYYSEDNDNYHVLGGNQNNKISIAALSKDRLLGARMPTDGGPYPRRKITNSADFDLSTNEQ